MLLNLIEFSSEKVATILKQLRNWTSKFREYFWDR